MLSRQRLILPLVVLAIGLGALTAAAVLAFYPGSRENLPRADVGGPFTLVSMDGRSVTDKDFDGAPHLVFFGFTHCPDVCPTTLFNLSEMFRAMGDKGRDVRALFITVDPERDTPEIMKSYVSSFDQRIVGLTGTRAEIDKTVKEYRAYAKKVPLKDGGYTMEHTALVYLMDGRGGFVGSFNSEKPPAEAARDLLKHL